MKNLRDDPTRNKAYANTMSTNEQTKWRLKQ